MILSAPIPSIAKSPILLHAELWPFVSPSGDSHRSPHSSIALSVTAITSFGAAAA